MASDVDRVWVPAVLALVTRSCVRSLPEHTRSVAGWSACTLLAGILGLSLSMVPVQPSASGLVLAQGPWWPWAEAPR